MVAWPFFWRYSTRGKITERETTRLVPFFWTEQEKRFSDDKPFRKSWQIWPFIQVDEKNEEARYRAFSIDPFHFGDGLEANYGTLFNIEDNRTSGKAFSFRFLWRFIRYDKDANESFFEILPLIAVHKKNGKTRRFTLAHGLFEVKEDEKHGKQTRILYFLKFGKKKTTEKSSMAEEQP